MYVCRCIIVCLNLGNKIESCFHFIVACFKTLSHYQIKIVVFYVAVDFTSVSENENQISTFCFILYFQGKASTWAILYLCTELWNKASPIIIYWRTNLTEKKYFVERPKARRNFLSLLPLDTIYLTFWTLLEMVTILRAKFTGN